MKKFEKKLIAGKELWRCVGYVEHRRSKNWVARIKGTSERYKFEREFLKFIFIDKVPYVGPLEEGGLFQFLFSYFTRGGTPLVHNCGYFTIRGGEFTPLTEAQVLEILAERENKETL